MSDFLTGDESKLFSKHESNDELAMLRVTFDSVLEQSSETWETLTNGSKVEISNTFFGILSPENIEFSKSDLYSKIKITEGMNALALICVSPEDVRKLSKYMMGRDLDEDSLDDPEMQQGALTECTNQYFGSLCTILTRHIDDVLQIDAPEYFNVGEISSDILATGISRTEKSFLRADYNVLINEDFKVKISLILTETTANGLTFRIKNTESKNLLKQNPELSRSIAEYFTLLSNKYKAIYSMVGVTGNVSVKEITSIHSLQCLDSSVINNYSVASKMSGKDYYNAYIFEKGFVDDMKDLSYDADEGKDSSWDILKELNNQFTSIFLDYCSDNKLVFDNVDCESFLKLPDNQYLLISFTVGSCLFYQIISFNLIDKLTFNLTKEDKESVDYSKVNNLYLQQQGIAVDGISSSSTDVIDEHLRAYKNIPVEVSAILGEKLYPLKEVLRFSPGYVIHFNRRVSEDVDICINDIKKAKGEVGELPFNKSNNYAVKLKKIIKEKCL